MDSIENYFEIRKNIDRSIQLLKEEHGRNMVCKKGCAMCCLNFDVFPIEFDAVKKQVSEEYRQVMQGKLPSKLGQQCIFLKQQQCGIYSARPIICRTHGYPLLNMNEAGDRWELSHCELNFTKVDEDYFHEENTYAQDTYNSQLFMLNKEYITSAHPDKSEFDLIPLSDLLKYHY